MMNESEYDELEKTLIDIIEESRREERECRIMNKRLLDRLALGSKEREKLILRKYRKKQERRGE